VVSKHVEKVVFAEHGIAATTILDVSATTNGLPPFFFPLGSIFNNAPAGSDSDGNPTGWMKSGQFLNFVKHFDFHVKPSNE
jgi:hypothetical protein